MPDLIINPPVVTAGTPEPELRLTELTRNGSPVSRALIVDQVISTVGAHVVGGRIPNAADGNYQAVWDATNGVNPPAQVTASAVIQPAAAAPTFGAGGTITIQGADIVFTPPPVTGGFPIPTVSLSVTRNGTPATVTNNRITNGAIGGSTDTVFAATWTGANGTLPNATRSATLTIPAAASAPGQFTTNNWSASTGLSPFEVVLNLSTLPSDGGSAITRLQYEAGFGWTDMPGLGTGPRVLSMPMAGAEYSMRVRAANTVGFGPSSTAKTVTSGAEEVVPTDPSALRAGTLTNPPVSVRLGVLDSPTSRPFTNAFKQAWAWQGDAGGANWASLVSGGYMTAGGQLISIAPGSNGFRTRLFFNAPAQSGLTGRHRLRWQGTCTIDLNGASNVNRDVPNEISFDFTANGSSWVDVIVRTINPAGGQIRNFSVVHADDIADFDAGAIFRTQYLDEVRNYRALRFDEWIGILRGDNEGGLRITDWASRGLPTDEIFYRFVPYEWMAALCNEVGADMWVCLPTAATDDHMQQAASLIRNLMPAPRHVYVEYSTKTWDFAGTPQAHYCAERGRIAFGTTANPTQAEFVNWYAMRATQMTQWWRAVWGNDTRLHTVVQHQADVVGGEADILVAPMWRDRNGTLGLPAYVAPHSVIDMLTVHAQIDGGMAYGGRVTQIDNWRTTLSQTEAFNRMRDQMLNGGNWSADRTVVNMIDKWQHFYDVATGYGMEMGVYEVGNHLNGVGGSSATTAFIHAFSVSAQMGEVYAATIDALREIGFTGPLAFAVEARYPDANISHGLQRWLGDHNPAWSAVEAINLINDGPAGRAATDFVGPFDTTDGSVVTPPPTPSYPTLPDGMLRPGDIPIAYSGPQPVLQITADWFNGVSSQGNPDLITRNLDGSFVFNAQFMNNDKRPESLNQPIWNSGMSKIIKPNRGQGRWGWVASSDNPAAVCAMFLYDNTTDGAIGSEIDFEYIILTSANSAQYGHPAGTRGFLLTVHMARTDGSGTRSYVAGFAPWTPDQFLTPALFEIDHNDTRAAWFINGTQVGAVTKAAMLERYPDANWSTTGRLEAVISVERHASWAGWTNYTTASMKIWGIRLPDAAPAINAVVVIGASHEFAMFGKDLGTPNAEATSKLAAAGHNLPVYGWATGGARLDQADDHYTAARNAFPNALIVSQFGGNNVSDSRPYPGGQTTFNNGLSGLLTLANGDTRFYPASLTFRDYDDSTFITPANGSKPYNENLLLPWITTNFPHAMAPYGRPKLDLYRFVLNDFENLLDTDNIHFTPTGYAALKDYYIDRIADILSGTVPAEIAERVYSGPPPEVTYPALTTAAGTPAYTTGQFGQAMNSNGTFWARAATSLTPLASAWGMEAWVRIPTVSRSNIFMGESGSAVYGVVRASGSSPAGQACITYAGANAATIQLTGGPRIDNNAWHHVAVQFRADGADLFVDGVLVASSAVAISATRPRDGAGTAEDSRFSVGHYASPTAFVWSGQVDEVRIWDGLALTAAFTPRTTAYSTLPTGTVAYWSLDGNLNGGVPGPTPGGATTTSSLATVAPNALLISDASMIALADGVTVTTWDDASPNARHLTASGGPIKRTDGTLHWVQLDGVNDYFLRNEGIIRPAVSGGQTVTVQVALRADPTASARLIAEGHSTNANLLYGLIQARDTAPQQLSHYIRNDAGTVRVVNPETPPVAFDNTVRTIAVEDTGSAVSVWIDGTMVRETTYTPGTFTPDRFALGGMLRSTASSFFKADVFASVVNAGPYSASLDTALRDKAGLNTTPSTQATTVTMFENGFEAS